MATAKKNAVSKVKEAIKNLPAFMAADKNAGNENVNHEDLAIPRILLLQDLSPQVKGSSKVPGANPGKFFNTATNDTYETIRCINLHYYRDFPVFLKRAHGGGFIAGFDSQEDADNYIKSLDASEKYDVVDTAHHFLLILDENNKVVSQADFTMSSTKHKFSRAWNGRLLATEAPRFGTIWTLRPIEEQNQKGVFYNITITDPPEWADEALFEEAKKAYAVVSKMKSGDINKVRGAE